MAAVYQWADLTAPELAAVAGDDPVAVLTLAAIEQHGPHLPLSTDVDIGEGLRAAAVERLAADGCQQPILVLPTLALGASLEHTAFAGTLSLTPDTAIAILKAIGAGLHRAGICRLLLFNSHGGNTAVIELAALELRAAYRMLVVKANYFGFALPAGSLPAEERAHGVHGGALETALMLHLAPDKVRREAVANAEPIGARHVDSGSALGPGGDARFAWMAQDLHRTGVAGDARLADAETGAQLVAHFAARLARIIEDTARFDLETLG